MQVLLGILAFLFCLFFSIVLFVLVCPCHYFIKVNKQEKLWGVLAIHVSFLKLRLCKEKKGSPWLEVYLLDQKLIDVQRRDGGRDNKERLSKAKIFQKKKEKVEKRRRKFLSSSELFVWKEFLERETFSLLMELCKKAWSEMRPIDLSLKGRIGFADPYYTGLLAAVLFAFTRENIALELDFSQAICEFALQIEGRIYLIVLIYYFLRSLLTYPLRSIVWGRLKKC